MYYKCINQSSKLYRLYLKPHSLNPLLSVSSNCGSIYQKWTLSFPTYSVPVWTTNSIFSLFILSIFQQSLCIVSPLYKLLIFRFYSLTSQVFLTDEKQRSKRVHKESIGEDGSNAYKSTHLFEDDTNITMMFKFREPFTVSFIPSILKAYRQG